MVLGFSQLHDNALGSAELGSAQLYEAVTATGFLPSDISGLTVWYDAADASTITESSGAVSQWDDKSGNGSHLVQATSTKQPLTGTRTINGVNTIDFDGTNDSFGSSSNVDLSATDNITVITVIQNDTTGFAVSTAFKTIYTIETSQPVQALAMIQRRDVDGVNGFSILSYADVGFYRATKNTFYTSPIIWVNRYNRNLTTEVKNYKDGGTVLADEDDGTQAANNTINFPNAPFFVGAENNNAQFLDAAIGEMLVYDTDLSASDLNLVGNYLAGKWGITWTDIS